MNYTNSLLGFVIGDAMGVPVEFLSRKILQNNSVTEMCGNGTHNQPLGTWSDDTSMTIATMFSIINKRKIDYNDIMNNFALWYRKAYFTAGDVCFDIGNTCLNAINRFDGSNAVECGSSDINSNGNGSLMRILPIAFYCYYKKLFDYDIYKEIKNISCLTHAHEISILGCYIYTRYIMYILDGYNKNDSYNLVKKVDYSMFSYETTKVYKRILVDDIKKFNIDDIKSSGYVVDTLEAVFWVVLNSRTFSSSILNAINLGDDTDTIGAIVGSICGLIYKMEDIPNDWLNNLIRKDALIDISRKYELILNEEKVGDNYV